MASERPVRGDHRREPARGAEPPARAVEPGPDAVARNPLRKRLALGATPPIGGADNPLERECRTETDAGTVYGGEAAFLEEPTTVALRPVADIETISDADLLAAIPTTERRDGTAAVRDLEGLFRADVRASHPTWPLSPREPYLRMLRDHEHVRIPRQRGNSSASPTSTRTPTPGFLHLRPEVAEALVDVGHLRRGAAGFGAHPSGDVQHFDLGNHGGAPDGTP
jgi:hypothetical protein